MDEGRRIVTKYAARSAALFFKASLERIKRRGKGVKSSSRVRVKVGCRMGNEARQPGLALVEDERGKRKRGGARFYTQGGNN